MKLFREIETQYYKLQDLKDVNFIYGRINSGKTKLLHNIYNEFNIPHRPICWYKPAKNKYTYYDRYCNDDVKSIPGMLLDNNNNLGEYEDNTYEKMFHVVPTFDDNTYACRDLRFIYGKCNYDELINTINTNFKDCGIQVKLMPEKFCKCIWLVTKHDGFTFGATKNEFKILYLFSVLSVFKLAEKSVIFLDEYLDSFDVETQNKIVQLMVKFAPTTQFFITTNNPNLYENTNHYKTANNIQNLLIK